jgi:hypothetical protein
MKKLVNVLAILSLASCFSLVACGDDDDTVSNVPTAGAGGQAQTGGTATAGTGAKAGSSGKAGAGGSH